MQPLKTLEWKEPGHLVCLDQTRLPEEKTFRTLRSREEVFEAIRKLRVRGAPAIGIAGAYGLCVDLFSFPNNEVEALKERLSETARYLESSRPTAVNLAWALSRMQRAAAGSREREGARFRACLLAEAKRIHEEDRAMCRAIGEAGAPFIGDGMRVLTHCNAGALATGGSGTALAVLYRAAERGRTFEVFADETRPLLQGARLTAFELMEAGIPVTVICDSAAGFLMRQGRIDLVVTGADRIALNGDTANKIGTFSLAKLAAGFDIPFYVAAPSSTFDPDAASGRDIPIEQRDESEVVEGFGKRTAPRGVAVCNPAFDVTDAALIRGFFTEKGVIRPPFESGIRALLENKT
jgi:methylthioribose-1-phosphate isomerase